MLTHLEVGGWDRVVGTLPTWGISPQVSPAFAQPPRLLRLGCFTPLTSPGLWAVLKSSAWENLEDTTEPVNMGYMNLGSSLCCKNSKVSTTCCTVSCNWGSGPYWCSLGGPRARTWASHRQNFGGHTEAADRPKKGQAAVLSGVSDQRKAFPWLCQRLSVDGGW